MGTSSDFQGGQGPRWTAARRAATSFAKAGGRERAQRLLGRYVAAQGGASGAAAGSAAGVATAQRLGTFLASVARFGLVETLAGAGLEQFVGSPRFDVVNALAQLIAGSGGTLDDQAARSAVLDVIEQLFEDFETDEAIDEIVVDADHLVELLRLFICRYIYNRLRTQIDERLRRLPLAERAARDRELRDTIAALVALDLPSDEALTLNWGGAEGRALIEQLISDTFEIMEQFE